MYQLQFLSNSIWWKQQINISFTNAWFDDSDIWDCLLHTELQHIRSLVSGSSTNFQSLARNAGTFVPSSSTECILTVLNFTENFSLKINALGRVRKQHNTHFHYTNSSPLRSTYVSSVVSAGHLVLLGDLWFSILSVRICGVTKVPCSRTAI